MSMLVSWVNFIFIEIYFTYHKTHHCNPINVSIFIKLCNYHNYLIPKQFHYPQKKLYPFNFTVKLFSVPEVICVTTILIENFWNFYIVPEIGKLAKESLYCKLFFNIDPKQTKVYGVNIEHVKEKPIVSLLTSMFT